MAVIFMYCDYRDQSNQTILGIIGSLAKQLLSQARSIPKAVWDSYKQMAKRRKAVDLEFAQAILELVFPSFDCVYICLDALDECQTDARRQLLELLKTVTGTTLRLFVTARPNIEAALVTSLADKSISRIPITANKEDLKIFLSQQFSRDRYPEAMDETLQAQITDKIIKWSEGM